MAIGQILFSFSESTVPDFLSGIVILEKGDLQFIFAFIIGGIFTLTIFSYTMVMNVLNRSINNYSPRLIPLILAERHHQLILGFTSGTIIYSMIMSIALSGNNIEEFPPLGAFVGVVFSIFCVFLFIYFIHSVSQAIHVNYILRKSFDRSYGNIQDRHEIEKLGSHRELPDVQDWEEFKTDECGYVQLPQIESLAAVAESQKCHILIDQLPGSFIYKADVLIRMSSSIKEKEHNFSKQVSVDKRVALELNETEIKHLVEVAIKGSSPAINDPGTSLTAINYMTQLLILRQEINGFNAFTKDGKHFVYVSFLTNKLLVQLCFEEMWTYMKHDPILVASLKESVRILSSKGVDINPSVFKD